MSVDLALRLVRSGVVADSDIEAVLLDSMQRGVAFSLAFAERGPTLAQLLERELSRCGAPLIRTVRAVPGLVAGLPVGLCSRLLAVPVRHDARTRTVDVAVVDPLDSHVAAELAFHLGAPVRILRAPLAELLAALGTLPERPVAPRVGGSKPLGARASEPPIPLVRRSIPPGGGLCSRTSPGVGSVPSPAIDVLEDEAGNPVIGLFRSKLPASRSARGPEGPPVRLQEDSGLALTALAEAGTPEAVVQKLVAGMSAVASRVLVFAVRSRGYDGRAGNIGGVTTECVRSLHVSASLPSVFSTAAEAGFYLGPLPSTPVHAGLARALGQSDEIYVVPVKVSGRAALMVVAAGFSSSFDATRRADQLVVAAGEGIERILRHRKRSGAD